MNTQMSNEHLQQRVIEYLYGDLTADARQQFESALQADPQLQALLDDFRRSEPDGSDDVADTRATHVDRNLRREGVVPIGSPCENLGFQGLIAPED